MDKKNNMYKASVLQWPIFVGCCYDCVYCPSSFQCQLKRWAKKNCPKCYSFAPHEHEERLHQSLPKTKYGQFIFVGAGGDIAFCNEEYLNKIVARIQSEPGKMFLMQSKNPQTFNRVVFPDNVILGTTLETNTDDLYQGISKAPKPSQRYRDLLEVKHSMKMVTIEPVIDFDLDVMVDWIKNLHPCMVWLGYDSKRNHLPEPAIEKVKSLYWELGARGFTVILKTIRAAWWEKPTPADGDNITLTGVNECTSLESVK